jgi:hypothetical protein
VQMILLCGTFSAVPQGTGKRRVHHFETQTDLAVGIARRGRCPKGFCFRFPYFLS